VVFGVGTGDLVGDRSCVGVGRTVVRDAAGAVAVGRFTSVVVVADVAAVDPTLGTAADEEQPAPRMKSTVREVGDQLLVRIADRVLVLGTHGIDQPLPMRDIGGVRDLVVDNTGRPLLRMDDGWHTLDLGTVVPRAGERVFVHEGAAIAVLGADGVPREGIDPHDGGLRLPLTIATDSVTDLLPDANGWWVEADGHISRVVRDTCVVQPTTVTPPSTPAPAAESAPSTEPSADAIATPLPSPTPMTEPC
jgi:hypothetical protein